MEIGEVVFSKAGRDSGRFFIVTEVVDDTFVLIADGGLRKLSKPKKKKIKHLTSTGEIIETIAKKLSDKTKVFDKELGSALRAYNN